MTDYSFEWNMFTVYEVTGVTQLLEVTFKTRGQVEGS